MIRRQIIILIISFAGTAMLNSCKKYLDAKPDKRFAVPSSIADFQAVLDYYNKADRSANVTEYLSDDCYFTDANWSQLPDYAQNEYIWKREGMFKPGSNDWESMYQIVYFANTTLDNLGDIPRTAINIDAWDNAMGMAYFLRAHAFLQVATLWCKLYNEGTASTDLGIPLRLNTDFNEPSKRSSVQQTYTQILEDLKKAATLLPRSQIALVRPGKYAAYGLMARTYLYMADYQNAYLYADSCLEAQSGLMDYNNLDPTERYPFPRFNIEYLFFCNNSYEIQRATIDSNLYRSYNDNDLRKTLFFKSLGNGTFGYRGSYFHNGSCFTGLATDGIYLIRAECEARLGKITPAMKDLNTLLRTRWKTGTFTNYTAANQKDALDIILQERRKELVVRSLRWMDVRRMNKEGRGITLKKTINNQVYLLPPNDPGYVIPIPDDVIRLSGMQQNPD